MMFEELFSRKRQEETSSRDLPKEVDAVQKRENASNPRSRHSSMSVSAYLWLQRLIIGSVVIVGIGIIGALTYGLVSDYISYSSGVTPSPSSSSEPTISTAPGE